MKNVQHGNVVVCGVNFGIQSCFLTVCCYICATRPVCAIKYVFFHFLRVFCRIKCVWKCMTIAQFLDSVFIDFVVYIMLVPDTQN